MEANVSRALIETIIRRTLSDVHEDSERRIRNLVDLALLVSKGRFQKRFFGIAQRMLENEQSPYYDLIRNTVSRVDIDKLVRIGINIGYNSCTAGARTVRALKASERLIVPWVLTFDLTEPLGQKQYECYAQRIFEGEALGIFTWALFCENHPWDALPLINEHPESAFFLFCDAGSLSGECLERLSELDNVMCVVRFDEDVDAGCAQLRDRRMPYSIYLRYGEKELGDILGGHCLEAAETLRPVFTCLLANASDAPDIAAGVDAYARAALDAQRFSTFPLEFTSTVRRINAVIAGDDFAAGFDRSGRLYAVGDHQAADAPSLFAGDLKTILKAAFRDA